MYLRSFDYFRAVAILFIVAGHTIDLVNFEQMSLFDKFLVNIFKGGTALFVFVSGYMFHYIFYQRFQYKKFLSSKFKNLLIPYLILSAMPIIYMTVKAPDISGGYYLPESQELESYFIVAFKYMFTGGFFTAYWYIPFILMIFVFSPLHFKFISLSIKWQLMIVLVLYTISLIIHRPLYGINVFQHFVYYTPMYLIGIICSINREWILEKFKNKEFYFLLLVFLFSFIQSIGGHAGNYHKPLNSFSGLDIMLIQKTFMVFFLMLFLERFEYKEFKLLKLLAVTSFSVFFIHPYFIFVLGSLEYLRNLTTNNPFLIFLLLFVFIHFMCVAIALIVKKCVPKYSKFLIGY